LAARRSSSGPRKPGTRSAGAKRVKTTKKRSQTAPAAGASARKSGAPGKSAPKSAGKPAPKPTKPKKGTRHAPKRSQAAKKAAAPGSKVSRPRKTTPGAAGPGAAQRKAGRALVAGHASLLGRVVAAYPRAKAATLALDGELRRGDLLHFRGHTTDFCQPADELHLAGVRVQTVSAGQLAGVAVRERVRPGDRVYRIEPGDAE